MAGFFSPPEGAFMWGGGGQRMTPEDIAMQRRMAADQRWAGADTSPVGHWAQGLARVAQGFLGGMGERRADRAAQANAEESENLARLLMGSGDSAPGSDAVLSALSNPYISPEVRDLAAMQWERMNPEPAAPTEFQRNFEWLQAMNPDFADTYLQGKIDPEIIIPLPSGPYVGPRSQLGATVDGMVQQPAQGMPAVGAIEDGYRFLGGDPADPNSWEAVR